MEINYQKVKLILAKLSGESLELQAEPTVKVQKPNLMQKSQDNRPLNVRIAAFEDTVKRATDRKQRVLRIYNQLKNQYHGKK